MKFFLSLLTVFLFVVLAACSEDTTVDSPYSANQDYSPSYEDPNVEEKTGACYRDLTDMPFLCSEGHTGEDDCSSSTTFGTALTCDELRSDWVRRQKPKNDTGSCGAGKIRCPDGQCISETSSVCPN